MKQSQKNNQLSKQAGKIALGVFDDKTELKRYRGFNFSLSFFVVVTKWLIDMHRRKTWSVTDL